jgi:hypothetical protein
MRLARRGFILIYVAVLLAAIGLLLMHLGRLQSPSPRYIERQIAHVLQQNEQHMLLDFVVAGLRKQKLPTDPRYQQFQQILASAPRPPSELEEQVAWLKSALSSLGMSLTDRKAQVDAAAASGAAPAAGTVPLTDVLFQPRKDPYTFKVGAVEYQVTVLPGNAFPNLNSIAFEPLWKLLLKMNIPEREVKELAAAIIDWRDADEFSTEGIGAERGQYAGRNPAYSPPNAPIRTWQELNYVRGMTPERVRILREQFVIGPANMTTLSPVFADIDVFAAMADLPPERVRELLQAYGRLINPDAPVPDVLLTTDADRIEKIVAFDAETPVLRIRIRSADSALNADYDFDNKRLISVW